MIFYLYSPRFLITVNFVVNVVRDFTVRKAFSLFILKQDKTVIKFNNGCNCCSAASTDGSFQPFFNMPFSKWNTKLMQLSFCPWANGASG